MPLPGLHSPADERLTKGGLDTCSSGQKLTTHELCLTCGTPLLLLYYNTCYARREHTNLVRPSQVCRPLSCPGSDQILQQYILDMSGQVTHCAVCVHDIMLAS